MSRKGVVEHRLGSKRAVLRLLWRQPISAIGVRWVGCPPAVLAQAAAPELKRWSWGFAKLIGGCSLGQQ